MILNSFINSLRGGGLTERQIENLDNLKKISKDFHKKSDTLDQVACLLEKPLSKDTLVIESGHQPNFLPHSGTWKKIFLLDIISKKFPDSLPLFGFADCNMSNAVLLSKNRVPAVSKEGFRSIGFKIPEIDLHKPFYLVEKPPLRVWEKFLGDIRSFYAENIRLAKLDAKKPLENLGQVIEMLNTAYSKSDTLSELNSFIFSQFSNNCWGLDVLFFRYSDLMKKKIFSNECLQISEDAENFNLAYNEAVNLYSPKGFGKVPPASLPFWLQCPSCKVKIPLASGEIRCKKCGSKYLTDDSFFKLNLGLIDPNAVSRNLVFSMGLGTDLFLSGAGGGLRYGLISEHIGKKLGYPLPKTLGVGGRDFYLGAAHRIILGYLENSFGILPEDLSSYDVICSKISRKISEIQSNASLDKKKQKGTLSFSIRLIGMSDNVFSLRPSILDIFVFNGLEDTLMLWESLLSSEVYAEKPFFKLAADITYGCDFKPVSDIYSNLSNIEVQQNCLKKS